MNKNAECALCCGFLHPICEKNRKNVLFKAFFVLIQKRIRSSCRIVIRVFRKGGSNVKKLKVEYVDLDVIDEGNDGFGLFIRYPSGECRVLHSVCVRRADAERIAETVNRLGVSECHICEVIEDLLP